MQSSCVQQSILNLSGPHLAAHQLTELFGSACNRREEGLFVKPLNSRYNGFRSEHRWTKLKKDYIPGEGDTSSFVVLAASHEKARGRELGVGIGTFTTFYVGLLKNRNDLIRDVCIMWTFIKLTRLAIRNASLCRPVRQQLRPISQATR